MADPSRRHVDDLVKQFTALSATQKGELMFRVPGLYFAVDRLVRREEASR
jgi:hypothetical protein